MKGREGKDGTKEKKKETKKKKEKEKKKKKKEHLTTTGLPLRNFISLFYFIFYFPFF